MTAGRSPLPLSSGEMLRAAPPLTPALWRRFPHHTIAGVSPEILRRAPSGIRRCVSYPAAALCDKVVRACLLGRPWVAVRIRWWVQLHGADRDQVFLLPPDVRDWLPTDLWCGL